MQCTAKAEPGDDDPAGQRTDPGPQESCQGGEAEAEAEVLDTEKSGHQHPEPDPVSRHSTQPEEKQTENIKEQSRSESGHNSQQYSNLGNNNNTFQSKFHSFEGQIPSQSQQQLGGKVSESGLQQPSALGRSEVAQNTDQFSHLNGRVQQQNIDQYSNNQQFEPGQSYQCAINPRHNNVRSRSVQHQQHQHPFNSNQHPANFLFHGQGPGPGGQERGFLPPCPPPGQQNFPSPPSFYPGAGGGQGPGHHQHPSYNGLHHQQSFGAGNCFPGNFPQAGRGHQQHTGYEDGSEDLDSGNNVPSGAVSGPGPGSASGQNNPHCHQFSLRARRRVRQRVDAGEPRNSYSSIPGFSFRHQSMMSRHNHYGGGDEYSGGLYRGGGFSLRGRGSRHQAPQPPPHPLQPPYNAHLPPGLASRYRHPSLVHSHPPSLPMAAAAAVHRALFLGQGGVTAGSGPGLTRGGRALAPGPGPGLALAASGDDTKTVQSLLRDETSERLDVLPPLITTPPTTPPTLVDSENTKVKISSSEGVSEPTHASAASDNNNQQQQSPTINNNNNNQEYSTTFSKNALLIRELLSTKLAAVTDMMEQGFGLVAAHNGPRDFSQHALPINNNDLKENAAQIMSHLLKVRQEMALNMSKDSDSDRHTESPGHISDNDIIEEEKEEPINLHQNGSGSDGEASPASPSSDAGNSIGSAKDQKASRLENIVGGLARSTSSPLPPQGCKKRKLYQPVQHDVNEDELKENEKREEPEQKKLKDGIENHIKSMQDQFQKMHQKMYNNHNDENADPEDSSELQIDLSQEDKKFNKEEITIEKRLNPKPFASLAHPLLNGSAEPLPIPPSPLNPNYMDLAKRFLQERQDQVTKEMITRDIVESTIGKNEIAEKLKAISPELEGLADILKSELKTSLTIIVDSIVQKYLTQKRQPLSKFSENSFFNQEPRNKTPSGRAPQVRDRSTPRTIQQPVSMANPSSLSNSLANTNNLVMTGSIAQPRISFPAPVSGDLALAQKPPMMTALYPGLGGQISDEEKDDESEQDDALNLTVTPKKKRHKVTDTRITPRTVSRLLGEQPSMADLHKHFGPGAPFMAPGFLPRPPFPGPLGSFLPNIPTSLPISHPGDHFPFSPFGFPGPLSRGRDQSPPSSRPRSASPPRDPRPPPPLIHPALLAAQSPDFPHHMRHIQDQDMQRPSSEAGSDDMKMDFGSSPFSLGNMSGK